LRTDILDFSSRDRAGKTGEDGLHVGTSLIWIYSFADMLRNPAREVVNIIGNRFGCYLLLN